MCARFGKKHVVHHRAPADDPAATLRVVFERLQRINEAFEPLGRILRRSLVNSLIRLVEVSNGRWLDDDRVFLHARLGILCLRRSFLTVFSSGSPSPCSIEARPFLIPMTASARSTSSSMR